LRERRPEKPGVDDSLAGGSARDSATGRSRARDETRPTDLGREGPETCSVTGRVSSCGGSLAVYGEEDVTEDLSEACAGFERPEVLVEGGVSPGAISGWYV